MSLVDRAYEIIHKMLFYTIDYTIHKVKSKIGGKIRDTIDKVLKTKTMREQLNKVTNAGYNYNYY